MNIFFERKLTNKLNYRNIDDTELFSSSETARFINLHNNIEPKWRLLKKQPAKGHPRSPNLEWTTPSRFHVNEDSKNVLVFSNKVLVFQLLACNKLRQDFCITLYLIMHTILRVSIYSCVKGSVKKLVCTIKYSAIQKSHTDLKLWQ